jgi:hypothetical protein
MPKAKVNDYLRIGRRGRHYAVYRTVDDHFSSRPVNHFPPVHFGTPRQNYQRKKRGDFSITHCYLLIAH